MRWDATARESCILVANCQAVATASQTINSKKFEDMVSAGMCNYQQCTSTRGHFTDSKSKKKLHLEVPIESDPHPESSPVSCPVFSCDAEKHPFEWWNASWDFLIVARISIVMYIGVFKRAAQLIFIITKSAPMRRRWVAHSSHRPTSRLSWEQSLKQTKAESFVGSSSYAKIGIWEGYHIISY